LLDSNISDRNAEVAMPKTLVTFLLDRTGSMEPIRDDTIGAFNAYLDVLKGGDEIYFTLIQFDSMGVEKLHVDEPVNSVPRLTRESFVPRAATPLIDAAYKTIKAVEKSVAGNPATKVVICIQTDGQENASTEHGWAELNALIKEKSEAGWQFNFMGASIDAYQQAAQMGISADQTLSYDSRDRAAASAAFSATAENTLAYALSSSPSTGYSRGQKRAAKDQYSGRSSASAAGNGKEKSVIVDDITL
jgi:hypothetical protein